MEFIAHRGASHDAPENTLAAVRLAWQQRADAVEVDVRLSKDGRLVVIHDDSTNRTCAVNKKISEQTLAQLRPLDVGRWKGKQWSGERIPTFEEVLATVPEGKRLFVELKCGPEGISELVRIASSSTKPPTQIVAIGFSRQTMKQLKAEMPELEVCWISKFRRNWKAGGWSPATQQLVAAAQEAAIGHRLPTAAEDETLKGAGLRVYVWTVDSPAKARQLAGAGVDGITTNRPGWLRQRLGA